MGISQSHLKELRAWKRRTKTSQRSMAGYAGISEQTFSKVLSGIRHFSADAAGKLADLTGIPVEKLLTDPDDTRIVKMLGKRLTSPTEKSNGTTNVV